MDFPHCLGGSFGGMQWEGRCLLLGDIPLVATFGTAAVAIGWACLCHVYVCIYGKSRHLNPL